MQTHLLNNNSIQSVKIIFLTMPSVITLKELHKRDQCRFIIMNYDSYRVHILFLDFYA